METLLNLKLVYSDDGKIKLRFLKIRSDKVIPNAKKL